MYSSHINFIFASACYMLLGTDKSKYGSISATLQQKQFDTSNNQLTLQFHMLMLNTILQDIYTNSLVLYSPRLSLMLMDMSCICILLWSNLLKPLLKRKTLITLA
jgi:hypothetical protein